MADDIVVERPTIKILYESDFVTVILGRSEDVLPTFTTESFDCVVTDPPYGAEWRSNMRAERFDRLKNDGIEDRQVVCDVIRECVRLVRQNRHLYIFGPSDVLNGMKVSEPATLIWHKGDTVGMGDLSRPWGKSHEMISFVVTKHRHAGKTGQCVLPVRVRKGSVLKFSPPTGRKVRHPSEKPINLLRELIESSTRQGDIILDPFAGSGSTGVAAILAGRKAVLIESDPQWVAMAVERVRVAEDIARRSMSI